MPEEGVHKGIRDRELNDLRMILECQEGRRLMWRILSMCGIYRLSFATNATIYFNEGQRSIGLKLVSDIHDASDTAYRMMAEEARALDIEDATRISEVEGVE
jgi:hypothetical protein